MDPTLLASWVQAFGSIGAIVASIYVVNLQHRKQAEVDRHRQRQKEEQELARLAETVLHGWTLVDSLVDDPDEPGALARHWRDNSNNDASIQLAQVDFALDQLRAVPILSVSVGANIVKTLNEVAYALIVARTALANEVSKPFGAETPTRVSDALFRAKIEAGKALGRSSAVLQAMRSKHQ